MSSKKDFAAGANQSLQTGDTFSHVGIFRPSFENYFPSNLLWFNPPPPLPCLNKYTGAGVLNMTERNTEDSILPDSEPTKLLQHPNKNLGGDGASDRYQNLPQSPFYSFTYQIFLDDDILLWCLPLFNGWGYK